MKIKMGWGSKIAFLYLGFVALISTLVFTSMRNPEELVDKDYYAQELKFQQRIDAMKNANGLANAINYSVNGHQVLVHYPAELVSGDFSGEIIFFRPSDASRDFKFLMQPGKDGRQILEGKALVHGLYKMQMNWQQNGKKYFIEGVIFIQ